MAVADINMDLFRTGHLSAFQEAYKAFSGSLLRLAGNIVGCRNEAEDVVADAYSRLWTLRERFAGVAGIRAFLYFATRNAALNRVRDRQREAAKVQEWRHLLPEVEPETVVIEPDRLEQVRAEIEQLPKRCRLVVKMLYFNGKNTAEIATAMNLSVQTVRNQKVRGLRLIRSALLKKEGLAEPVF